VHDLPANGATPQPVLVGDGGLIVLAAGGAMSRAALDAPELLDVDMDQLAGPLALIALGRLEPRRPSVPIPIRVRVPDTVDSGMAGVSAISGPVSRNRRSAAIASTRRSQVRLATVAGAEDRSSSPNSRSAR
jgi:hypothetical protein